MEAPIFIDNHREIKIGKNFYSNIHFSFIAGNTVDEDGVAHDFEYGKPIKIGNDVWIASNVTVCGGVTIGDKSVIGAGSVVTKDIPEGVLAAGNPCRVIRKITEQDSIYLKAKETDKLLISFVRSHMIR